MAPFKLGYLGCMFAICYFPVGFWCRDMLNTNTYQIPSGRNRLVSDNGAISRPTSDYYMIENFGIVPVWATLETKNWEYGEYYDRSAEYVKPNERRKFQVPDTVSPYFYRLVVRNRADAGAVVYVGVNDYYGSYRNRGGGFNYLSINSLAFLKSVTTFGAGYIPVVGGAISALIDFFWQVAGPDIWSQVSSQVEAMVGKKLTDMVTNIIKSKVMKIKKRLWAFAQDYKLGPMDDEDTYVLDHYLNLAQDLFGLEEEFIMDKKNPDNMKINYHLLPYYVKIVTLQMQFYNFGLTHQKQLGLTRSAIRGLYMYKNAILFTPRDGAVDYIYDIYKVHTRNVYDQCDDGEEIYNCMANERTYVIMNGIDYISTWIQPVESQLKGLKPLDCNPIFSTYLGRPSHEINKVGSSLFEPEPLLSESWDGKCSRMNKIHVFKCDGKLCGMKTFFTDMTEHTMGRETSDKTIVDLEGHTIKKLEVYGYGAVEGLEFHLDDGHKTFVGRKEGHLGTFAVDDYFIVGILVTNGVATINRDLIANIAVSYLQNGY